MTKVAILGVTGYVGRSLLHEFFLEKEKFTLSLFSRTPKKVETLLSTMSEHHNYEIKNLVDFSSGIYDVIINCTGIGDPSVLKNDPFSIFTVTEEIDSLILSYITKNKETLYINLSSGAVYGNNNEISPHNSSQSIISLENMTAYDYYAIAKINSEAKHRAMKDAHIIDLRIFAFFSSFVDSDSGFFMSEVIRSLIQKNEFMTTEEDMVRDYICPKDLFSMICLVIEKKTGNYFFDVYSKFPVSKFEILDFCKNTYGLTYSVRKKEETTGVTKLYYPRNKKASVLGYEPKYTSLVGIQIEIDKILKYKKTPPQQ